MLIILLLLLHDDIKVAWAAVIRVVEQGLRQLHSLLL